MHAMDKLRTRYEALMSDDRAREGVIDEIESELAVRLPDQVREISKFFGGQLLGGIGHHRFDTRGPLTTVTEETLRLRSAVGLPHRYVVLGEPPESLLLLDTESGAVIWLDGYDVHALAAEQLPAGSPTQWSSYAEFFSYLLDEEVEERRWLKNANERDAD